MSRTLELVDLLKATQDLPRVSRRESMETRVPVFSLLRWVTEARHVLGEKTYPIGTVRKWSAGDFVKTDKGWIQTDKPHRRGAPVVDPGARKSPEDLLRNTQSAIDGLRAKLASGEMTGTLVEQVKRVKAVGARHRAGYESFMKELRAAAVPDAEVTGRVKTFQSTVAKITSRPGYEVVEELMDVTGTRIVCNDLDDVKETVARLRAAFKVIKEDDYNAKPLGAMKYRSHHVFVEDQGLVKEIQVRTHNQDAMADWSHDVYKPITPVQRETVARHKPAIESYAASVSDHFASQDRGEAPVDPPVTPAFVRDVFGAIRGM